MKVKTIEMKKEEYVLQWIDDCENGKIKNNEIIINFTSNNNILNFFICKNKEVDKKIYYKKINK